MQNPQQLLLRRLLLLTASSPLYKARALERCLSHAHLLPTHLLLQLLLLMLLLRLLLLLSVEDALLCI